MSNARTFALELGRAAEKNEKQLREEVVEIGQYLASQIINRSPVDTGRFVGNWNAAIGVPDVHTTISVDPQRGATLARINAKVSEFKNFSGWPIIYYTEALPYANKLEHGSSKQAPQGIVSVSMANTRARFPGAVK